MSTVPSRSTAAKPAPTAADAEAEELLKMLELEMARQRALRHHQTDHRRTWRALSVLLLLGMLCAAFYALWRLETLHSYQTPYRNNRQSAADGRR